MLNRDELPLHDWKYRTLVSRCVEGVNGFVYAGDRQDAVIKTIQWLRDNPEDAALLLEDENA